MKSDQLTAFDTPVVVAAKLRKVGWSVPVEPSLADNAVHGEFSTPNWGLQITATCTSEGGSEDWAISYDVLHAAYAASTKLEPFIRNKLLGPLKLIKLASALWTKYVIDRACGS